MSWLTLSAYQRYGRTTAEEAQRLASQAVLLYGAEAITKGCVYCLKSDLRGGLEFTITHSILVMNTVHDAPEVQRSFVAHGVHVLLIRAFWRIIAINESEMNTYTYNPFKMALYFFQ